MARRLPALLIAAALAVTACGGAPTSVPAPTDFAIPDVKDQAAEAAAAQCSLLEDRRERAACAVPIAEDLLARAYAPIVESRGLEFVRPTVVTAEQGATTACGELTRVAYCPQDGVITMPIGFFSRLGDRAAAEVEWGQATADYFAQELTPEELATGGSYGAIMALAHEYAHHVQTLLGYERLNTEAMAAEPDKAARHSSEFELMADCFAGWAAAVLDSGGAFQVSPADQWAAITALAEVGDDYIQENRGGEAAVKPAETFNHGAANERANAWTEGAGLGFDGAEPYEGCLALANRLIDGREPAPAASGAAPS